MDLASQTYLSQLRQFIGLEQSREVAVDQRPVGVLAVNLVIVTFIFAQFLHHLTRA